MGKLKVLDLFSGLGFFSYGLEKTAGFETIGFCEIDKFCKRVLKKHWPEIPIINDVKEICRWTWKGSKAQTLLRQAFLARTLHSLEMVPDLPGNVLVYGGKYAEPFAWYDHPSRCWRTWQRCLVEGWERYSGAWPRSGMTRNGIAYRLPELAWGMDVTGYGLWPTPQAKDGQGYYTASLRSAKYRREKPQQLHWIHHALLMRGQEGIAKANPRFSLEMLGAPISWMDLKQEETP